MSHTASGRTCQVWSAPQLHDHNHKEVGDHNLCRNPIGDPDGVWCYTTDPDKRWEHCSHPICARTKSKVLDFSAVSDHEPDSNGEYTGATLKVDILPESFTICSAFMMEAWTTKFVSASMFILLDEWDYPWGAISLSAAPRHTGY